MPGSELSNANILIYNDSCAKCSRARDVAVMVDPLIVAIPTSDESLYRYTQFSPEAVRAIDEPFVIDPAWRIYNGHSAVYKIFRGRLPVVLCWALYRLLAMLPGNWPIWGTADEDRDEPDNEMPEEIKGELLRRSRESRFAIGGRNVSS